MLEGQSNYAFNIILKEPNKALFKKLCDVFDENRIEYRVGSAGGGNQLRQPYVRKLTNYKDDEIIQRVPNAEHVHFFGMYIGNFPDLKDSEIVWLNKILADV